MAVSVREAGSVISNFIREGRYFSGITFDKYGDSRYVSYVSDVLNGIWQRAFGGNYESSITFSYSQGVGFVIEVYFSNSQARFVQHKLKTIVRDGIEYYGFDNFVRCDFTPFIPNESALTFSLTTHPCSVSEMTNHINLLSQFIKDLTLQL